MNEPPCVPCYTISAAAILCYTLLLALLYLLLLYSAILCPVFLALLYLLLLYSAILCPLFLALLYLLLYSAFTATELFTLCFCAWFTLQPATYQRNFLLGSHTLLYYAKVLRPIMDQAFGNSDSPSGLFVITDFFYLVFHFSTCLSCSSISARNLAIVSTSSPWPEPLYSS